MVARLPNKYRWIRPHGSSANRALVPKKRCLARWIFLLVTALLLAVPGAANAQQDSDDGLLGDLEKELLKDLDLPTQDKPPQKDAKKDPRAKAGEDLGQPSEDNPLRRIMERMKLIEEKIAEADASQQTQKVQQEVLDDLSLLIEQLQKQCAQSQQSGKSQPSSSQKPKAGNSAAQRPSDKPSPDSRERMDKAKKSKVAGLSPEQLVKEVWGHLPPKIVEQMTRQSVDKFLPKYEQLIEDYFRRLAEDPEDSN